MEPIFSDNISDRQLAVMAHTMGILGADMSKVHYFKSEEKIYDIFPVDVALIEPTESFKYFLVTTVGLSEYDFSEDSPKAELFMLLPPSWKTDFSKPEYYWPIKFVQSIAYSVINNKIGAKIFQIYCTEKNEEVFTCNNFVGGIITIPELTPIEMIEEKIDGTYTRFFQIVPVSGDQVQKIDEIGPRKFVDFDLHDADGPILNVDEPKLRSNAGVTLDKIIEHNENKLKGN